MFKKAAIAVCLVAAAAGLARAGYKGGNYNVYISTTGGNMYARGAMGNVRNSTDSVEYITCYVWNISEGTNGSCSAKDANGVTLTCNIPSGLFTSLFSLGPDSFIQFYVGSNGDCYQIDSAVGSYFAPKQL